jgi:hypothetical protein
MAIPKKLPKKLKTLIKNHLKAFPECKIHKEAQGMCHQMSVAFGLKAVEEGLSAKAVDVYNTKLYGKLCRRSMYSDHIVAIVEGIAVDLTAKQFDPNLPCPWVFKAPKAWLKKRNELKDWL